MARVEATPVAGYLPAEPTSPAAKNGRTSAGPRRTSRTGNLAASAPAAGRSPPSARRTPTLPTAAAGRSATLPPAAGVGRARRIRSPSPTPLARTPPQQRLVAGDLQLHFDGQISHPPRPVGSSADRGDRPRGSRQRRGRLKIQAATSKWRAPDHAANGRTADASNQCWLQLSATRSKPTRRRCLLPPMRRNAAASGFLSSFTSTRG
jgi:hypothetical protein